MTLVKPYQDSEIIVVDDASTDNTEEVVKSFDDERIRTKYFCHSKNKGVSAARNTGIKANKGEYIGFLGSDDEWLPEKLEEQIAVFEKSSRTVGVVFIPVLYILSLSQNYIYVPDIIVCMTFKEIDDHLWELIKPYLPSQKPNTGRPRAGLRKIFKEVILYIHDYRPN